MSLATVIIPTFNRPDHLAAVLEALARQAEPGYPFSVVVVDDGSDPPARLPDRAFPFDIRIARLERNRGRAAARNAGLAVVEAPLVIFLDDDVRPQEGFVAAYVRALDPAAKVVGLGAVEFDPSVPRDRLTRYLETRGVAKLAPSEPIPARYFLTYNSALPTGLLRAVGGFDEGFTAWGGEDLDLGWRLQQAGADFVRVPDARAFHAHRRTLEGVWTVSIGFGSKSLPHILSRHPGLVPVLRVDLLGPREYARGRPVRRWLVQAATWFPLPDVVKWLVSRSLWLPWPTRLFDYLIASAWRRGLDGAASKRGVRS